MVKLTTALVCGLSEGRAPRDISRIKAVEQALDGIGDLTECARGAPLRGVDLAHNALSTLDGMEALERSVEWLNVSHNRVKSLEELSNFRRLKVGRRGGDDAQGAGRVERWVEAQCACR